MKDPFYSGLMFTLGAGAGADILYCIYLLIKL